MGGTASGKTRAGEKGGVSRALAFDLIVLLGLAALFVANLCLGSVETSPAEVLRIIAAGPGDTSTAAQVIWQIRLPRAIEAMLLGGALSLSGFLLQTFFANPIADPFVLGISSGAKLVVAVVMIVVLGAGQVMSPAASVGAALAGSLLTMGLVLLISRRVRTQSMLIVAGVMVGYICSAATNFLVAFADDQSIVNLDNWSRGSFSGATWPDVAFIAVCVLAMGAAVLRSPSRSAPTSSASPTRRAWASAWAACVCSSSRCRACSRPASRRLPGRSRSWASPRRTWPSGA